MMKTKAEILELVASTYNLNNRSKKMNINECFYSKDGRTCAFGMLCVDPSELVEGKKAHWNINNLGMDIIKPEFRGHENDFYDEIQTLHDGDEFWNENGLSASGERRKDEILGYFPLGS